MNSGGSDPTRDQHGNNEARELGETVLQILEDYTNKQPRV